MSTGQRSGAYGVPLVPAGLERWILHRKKGNNAGVKVQWAVGWDNKEPQPFSSQGTWS